MSILTGQFAVGTQVIKLGQKLYAPTKTGNVKTWSAHVIGCDTSPTATIQIVSQTKLGGKAVVREDVIAKGKNIGKSNETTPFRQAVSEAESRYRKKLDQGYRTEIPTDTSRANNNAMDLPKPMLAHPIEKVKEVTFPAFFQPKLDGHRAIVTKQDGEMLMYSRQGKPITSMDHILVHLDLVMEDGDFLDGELYVHGEMLQNIGSLIKRKQDGSERVEYWVYDTMLDLPYEERYKWLQERLSKVHGLARVHLLQAYEVASMEEADAKTDEAISRRYEGGILRLNGSGYEAGFRSRNLLKLKRFDDSEAEILDVIECKVHTTNGANLQVAKFICRSLVTDAEFDCTVFGTMEEKDAIYREKEKYIGKILTVKHSGYTADKKPWHPVALRLREDI